MIGHWPAQRVKMTSAIQNVTAQGGEGDALIVLVGQDEIGHGAQHGQRLGPERNDDEGGQER